MGEILDKLNELKKEMKPNIIVQEETISKESINKALIDALKENPENAVNLKLGETIGKKLSGLDGNERLSKTGEKIIDTTLMTHESEAEGKYQKAKTGLDNTFFSSHKDELQTGGIKEQTYMERMTKVVDTNHLWWNIYYNLFLWWVIGINTFAKSISSCNWFFKFLLWTIMSAFLIPFIPFSLLVGIVRVIGYLISIPIYKLIKFIKLRKQTNNEIKEQLKEKEQDEVEQVV